MGQDFRTFERVGETGLWTLLSTSGPGAGSIHNLIAFDGTRGRVVAHNGLTTFHWDGATWTTVATSLLRSFSHVVAHEGRGTVIAFGGPDPYTSNDLYEWNGSTWNVIPTTNRPPRPAPRPEWPVFVGYLTAAYDARRDKLVLFGAADFIQDGGVIISSSTRPEIWEWDLATGWTSRIVTGAQAPFDAGVTFFDSHRGTLTAIVGLSGPSGWSSIYEWDGGPAWSTVMLVNTVGGFSIAHDPVRGMSFMTDAPTSGSAGLPLAYVTVHPARFATFGGGCTGSAGEPVLKLTQNWTRAWLGRTLSVDVTNLPLPIAWVIIGWSNTFAGTTALPMPLDPFGMPGCSLRVSPDILCLVVGGNGTATLAMTVPSTPALVGLDVFEQGVSIDPSANAAGMVMSNAVRVTIGNL